MQEIVLQLILLVFNSEQRPGSETKMDDQFDLKEYLQFFCKNFKDSVESQADMFIEGVSNFVNSSVASDITVSDRKEDSADLSSYEEMKDLQAKLANANALISILRGALQVSNALLEENRKKK